MVILQGRGKSLGLRVDELLGGQDIVIKSLSENFTDIRGLSVVLTAACNLRCAYCYQDRRSGWRMSWSTLRQAIDLLLSSRHTEVTLRFYGGRSGRCLGTEMSPTWLTR